MYLELKSLLSELLKTNDIDINNLHLIDELIKLRLALARAYTAGQITRVNSKSWCKGRLEEPTDQERFADFYKLYKLCCMQFYNFDKNNSNVFYVM